MYYTTENENYRKYGIVSKAIEISKQADEEAYEVFLEYRWKMKEAELKRLIEEGLITKEDLEAEM